MEEEKVIQVSVQLPAQVLQGFTDIVRQLRQLAAELLGAPAAGLRGGGAEELADGGGVCEYPHLRRLPYERASGGGGEGVFLGDSGEELRVEIF